ncbi:MAG TPA: hypothetical protein VFJ14_09695 [Nocardioidaceae bacterium]|nr:hypothetical protein [Nocardioidaceae bacterium]
MSEKLAEIGVSRHKNALLLASHGQHHVVHAPGQITLRDMDDVVPGGGKH